MVNCAVNDAAADAYETEIGDIESENEDKLSYLKQQER